MLAALAADAPELTAAITALVGHHPQTGSGVVIGSNVFNLAALLGVGALVAGSIALHRRVIVLEGVIAVAVALLTVLVVLGPLSPLVGLILAIGVLVPYLLVLGVRRDRLRRLGLPDTWTRWIAKAIREEELELEGAIEQRPRRRRDLLVAALAVLVVVGASVVMEQAGSKLGTRHGIPEIVVGGLILAGVTSLPNTVAAVYLATRGRGAATLSTAMNSNALNITAGLLLPASFVGLSTRSGSVTLIAAYYLGLTVFVLVSAYSGRGLRRAHGVLIVCAYLAFAGLLLASAYSSSLGFVFSLAVPAVAGIAFAGWRLGRAKGKRDEADLPAERDRQHALQQTTARTTLVPTPNGREPQPPPTMGHRRDESLVPGWPVRRLWYLALAVSSLIACVDAILGRHVILIGLLITGPCCALLTARWTLAAAASAWAIALAIVLGLPDQVWGTTTHLVFLGAVVIVAIVATSSAAILQRHR